MGRAIDYMEARTALESFFADAEADSRGNQVVKVARRVEAAAEILFGSSVQSCREALVGCALARILDAEIDITQPYMNLSENAFNGRTLDERVINPFLHEKEIPSSKGPYLAAFRRSVSFSPETQKGMRDKDAFGAMLAVIDELKAAGREEAERCLRYLLTKFVELREKSHIALARIKRLSIDQYAKLIKELLETASGGLLPVLLTVAMFTAIKEVYGLPWAIDSQGINVSDAASGAGGDVTVRTNDKILIAVEVTERIIDESRIRSTFRTKILPNKIDDYLFLFSGERPSEEARERARSYFAQGHEVNFVLLHDWIMTFLTVLGADGRAAFTDCVIEALDKREVSASIKVAWNEIVRGLVTG
jgi:hypothetical protein